MRVSRLAVLAIIGTAALTVGIISSQGATPSTAYTVKTVTAPDPQLKGRWAERTAAAGNMTSDGVPDYFAGNPLADINGVADTGRVYLVNGKTNGVVYVIDSPSPQANSKFGFFISVVGDLNRDRKSELAVGTDAQDVYTGSGTPCGSPEPNGCNEDQGAAWVFSGADGKLLYALSNPAPQGSLTNSARFGSRIGRAGDLNGDGRPEIIVGASNNDVPAGCGSTSPLPSGCRVNQGQAFIFNGASGALLRTLDLPVADQQPVGTCASSCGSLGIAVQSPGDTNRDGVADQLVDAGSYSFPTGSGGACGTPEPNGCNEGQGRMYLFSGKDGRVLLHVDDPEPQAGAVFGFQDAAPLAPGDVNKDGFADLYGNGFIQNGPTGEGQGKAWVFNGRTGAVLYALDDPTPEIGGQFGWSMSSTDYNKDGVFDLYVGQSPHHVAGASGSGGSYVFNGRNGSLLKALELPQTDRQQSASGNLGPNLGWTNSSPGDLNRDGQPDFIAGAPFFDSSAGQDEGRLYVFYSTDTTKPAAPKISASKRSSRGIVVIRFSSRDVDNTPAELRYRCAFGRSALRGCKATIRVRLKPGPQTLRVQAIDIAGNKSSVSRKIVR